MARHNLTTLPVEIISRVMEIIDWHSLLTMRQTCKKFDVISRTRGVWLGQYHQYVMQRRSPTYLEGQLSSYSVEELERWVLFRRSADAGWKRPDLKFTQKRWITRKEVGVTYIDGTCIVPGGRWLLIGGGDGSVTAYDLDASILKKSLLISPNEDEEPVHHIAIEMDCRKDTSNVRFTLALSAYNPLHFTASPYLLKFFIWQVTLTGHSSEARLTAKLLRTIVAHADNSIVGIGLQKNLLTRTHYRHDLPYLSYIEVFDWEQSTSSAHCKAIIFPGVPIRAVRLLPGDRLLAFSDTHMIVYPIVVVVGAEIAPPTTAPHITEPLWKLPLDGKRTSHGALSQGLSNGVASYFIVKAEALHEVAVPHDERQTPSVRQLTMLEQKRSTTYAVGFEKAFIQHSDRSITRLALSWDIREADEDMCRVSSCFPVISRDYPTTPKESRRPKLDEETGRIVQDFREGVLVIDTAMIYMDR